MDSRQAIAKTGRVVLVALIALLGWETWTLVNAYPGDTISETIWSASEATDLVPFASGVLMGHWFWQRKRRPE